MDTPASLLERLREPAEQAAWARFVDLYTPLLYAWLRRAGCSAHDAADLVQEVFTTLVQKLPGFRYDERRGFRGWLRTLVLNRWRNRRRQRAYASLNAEGMPEPAAPDDLGELAEAEYRQHLVRRALRLMQAEFEPTTWRACWEYVVCGRPSAEVARELGLSVNAVYLAKARVLARLREELAGMLH